jgi:hypothetical protein
LLTVEEFEQIHKDQMDVTSLTATWCFQPMQPDICGEVCDVRLFKGNKNKGGMDIAFVKVDESRKPKKPSFPYIFSPFIGKFRKKCFIYYECLILLKNIIKTSNSLFELQA